MSRLASLATRTSFAIALLCAFSFPSHSQTPTATATDATFIQLQHDWAQARKQRDVPFLEKFYATEFTVGNMNGAEATRAQDLAMFSSGTLKPAVITDGDLKVHIYGLTALVTGTEHLEGSYRGHTGAFDLRFTNLFVYRDSRWQLVRHQATAIPKP